MCACVRACMCVCVQVFVYLVSWFVCISVTEDEIRVGMLEVPSPHSHCVAYFRDLQGISSVINTESTSRYIDTKQNKVDAEAQKLLNQLKQKVVVCLDKNNVQQMSIPWTGSGISLDNNEHIKYLDSFCTKVYDDMKFLIDQHAVQAVTSMSHPNSGLYDEVLRHTWFCVNKCKLFCGQEDVLDAVKTYLCCSHHQRPFVIHGLSGSGKTSIMAKVAVSAKEWLCPGLVTIVRFLGTSPGSATIHCVLQSIVQQICLVFDVPCPSVETLEDFSVLAQYFKTQLLQSLPVSPSCPLLLMLDSVDQLLPTDGAHKMNWLPKMLPANVFVVVSVLSVGYECLSVLHSIMPHPECYLEVCPMSVDSAGSILDVWLVSAGRTLTYDQRSLLLKTYLSCTRPLFLKLLFDQARYWKSDMPSNNLVLPVDVRDAIAKLFEGLEVRHGVVLVQRALGYITAARNGVTQAELEDVLSLDNDVLSDVYQYWNPPDLQMVRLPQLLWKRVRFEIDEYLVERQADGRTVLAWYHRQFIEAATDRYLSNKKDILACHSGLADLFNGKWAKVGKHLHLIQRNLYLESTQRGVAAQPLQFGNKMPNLRKMSEYPRHLIRSGLTFELKKNVLCNFEWLYNKMQTLSLVHVIEDFDEYLHVNSSDNMIGLLRETLLLSSSNLRTDANCLAAQLIGRTHQLSQNFPDLSSLIASANHWAQSSPIPMLIPQSTCLIAPGGPLKMSLAGHPQRIEKIMLKTDEPVAVSMSRGYNESTLVNVWDLTLGECLHSFVISEKKLAKFTMGPSWVAVGSQNVHVIHLKTGECMRMIECDEEVTSLVALQSSSSDMLVIGHVSGVVAVWNITNGDLFCKLGKHSNQITSLCMLSSSRIAVSGSSDSTIRVWDLQRKRVKFCFQYHRGEITCLAVCESPRGIFTVSGSTDTSLRKWCLQTGKCLAVMEGHTKTVKDVAILPSGSVCMSASLDKTLRLWDLNTGQTVKTLKGHDDGVWCVAVTAGGSMAVSGSKDDLLKVWDTASGECLHTLESHSSWISCVAASQYGKWVVSGSNDKLLKVWDIQKQQTITQIARHFSQPECIAASSKAFYSGAPDGIKVWALDGRCLHSFQSSTSCLASTSDGKYIVSGGMDKQVKIWDVKANCLLQSLQGHNGNITCVLVVGVMAFTGSADGMIKIWRIPQGDRLESLESHEAGIKCVAVSDDAEMVASGSFDKSVRVWSLSNGHLKQCTVFEGHTDIVWCIRVTRDKKKAISGASDKTVRVWSIQDQVCLHVLQHHESVKALAVTADSKHLISGDHSSSNQLRLWNLENGECLLSFEGHSHAVMSIILVDNDRLVVSGSRDGTIKLWAIDGKGHPLATFDAQAQAKHLAHVKASPGTKSQGTIAAATKTGHICILSICMQ